ncbi:hypothetical protein CSUI_002508 [Cystoisospora suis]|uniref:Uncharacterized protein n=1 Tax=Cystoisospora suis TaxID=483139 RepID=A0A2C6KTP4_9APIC|nr:hypothetical protein CSUI_002508 [Cystoisospora suis]
MTGVSPDFRSGLRPIVKSSRVLSTSYRQEGEGNCMKTSNQRQAMYTTPKNRIFPQLASSSSSHSCHTTLDAISPLDPSLPHESSQPSSVSPGHRHGVPLQTCASSVFPDSPRILLYFQVLVWFCLLSLPIDGVVSVVLSGRGGAPSIGNARTVDSFVSTAGLLQPLQMVAPSLAPLSSSCPLKHLRLLVTRESEEAIDDHHHSNSERKRERKEDDSVSSLSSCDRTPGVVVTILPSRGEGLSSFHHLDTLQPASSSTMPPTPSIFSLLNGPPSSLSASSSASSSSVQSAPSSPLFVLDVSPSGEPAHSQSLVSSSLSSHLPGCRSTPSSNFIPSSSVLAGTAAAACCCDALVLPLSYAHLGYPLSLLKQELPQLLFFSTALQQQLNLCQLKDTLAANACAPMSAVSTPMPPLVVPASSGGSLARASVQQGAVAEGHGNAIPRIDGQATPAAPPATPERLRAGMFGAPHVSPANLACRKKPLIVFVTDFKSSGAGDASGATASSTGATTPPVSDLVVLSLDTPEPVALQVASAPGVAADRTQENAPEKDKPRWRGSHRWNKRLGMKSAPTEQVSGGAGDEHRLAALAVRNVLDAVWRDVQFDVEMSKEGHRGAQGTGARNQKTSSKEGEASASFDRQARNISSGEATEKVEKPAHAPATTTQQGQEETKTSPSGGETREPSTRRDDLPPEGAPGSSDGMGDRQMTKAGETTPVSEKNKAAEDGDAPQEEKTWLALSSLYSVYVVLIPPLGAEGSPAHENEMKGEKTDPRSVLSQQIRHVIQGIISRFRRDELNAVNPWVGNDACTMPGRPKAGNKQPHKASHEPSCEAEEQKNVSSASTHLQLPIQSTESAKGNQGTKDRCLLPSLLLLRSLPLVAETCYGALNDIATGHTFKTSFLRRYGRKETGGEGEEEEGAEEEGRSRHEDGLRSVQDVAAVAGEVSRRAVEGVVRMLKKDDLSGASGRRISWAFDVHRIKEATKQRFELLLQLQPPAFHVGFSPTFPSIASQLFHAALHFFDAAAAQGAKKRFWGGAEPDSQLTAQTRGELENELARSLAPRYSLQLNALRAEAVRQFRERIRELQRGQVLALEKLVMAQRQQPPMFQRDAGGAQPEQAHSGVLSYRRFSRLVQGLLKEAGISFLSELRLFHKNFSPSLLRCLTGSARRVPWSGVQSSSVEGRQHQRLLDVLREVAGSVLQQQQLLLTEYAGGLQGGLWSSSAVGSWVTETLAEAKEKFSESRPVQAAVRAMRHAEENHEVVRRMVAWWRNRKPIEVSLQYVSPTAFGLSNVKREVGLSPSEVAYAGSHGSLKTKIRKLWSGARAAGSSASSGAPALDEALEKSGGSSLLPDLSLLSSLMVYGPQSGNS